LEEGISRQILLNWLIIPGIIPKYDQAALFKAISLKIIIFYVPFDNSKQDYELLFFF
jgi:hypothetical protein